MQYNQKHLQAMTKYDMIVFAGESWLEEQSKSKAVDLPCFHGRG